MLGIKTKNQTARKRVTFLDDDLVVTTKKQKSDDEQDLHDDDPEYSSKQSDWGSTAAMPPEILTKIFMMLTEDLGSVPTLIKLSKVCRLWRDVASSPLLWHTVDLSTRWVKKKCLKEKKLTWLLTYRLSRVKSLSLSGWNFVSIKLKPSAIATRCPDLQEINFSGCKNLPGDILLSVVNNCPSLKSLDISGTWTHSASSKGAASISVTSELVKTLGKRLVSLSLGNNCMAGLAQIISLLANNCPNLELLDLSNLHTDKVLIHLEQLQEGCPKLRVLRLTNSPVKLASASAEQRLQAPGFSKLEELSIAVNGKCLSAIDNSGLERILKNAENLKLLDVRGCSAISSGGLVHLHLWNVKHLFLSGCLATRSSASGSLELVIRKWRQSLVELDLSWTLDSKSLDEAILALAEDRNPTLRVLDLCGSAVNFNPLRKILESCENLQVLNLTSCKALPRGIKRLYPNADEIAKLKNKISEDLMQAEANET